MWFQYQDSGLGSGALKEKQTPPPRKRPKIFVHQSIENLLKRKQNFVSAKVTEEFLAVVRQRENRPPPSKTVQEYFYFCFGHMIYQNGPEFPQDSEYAIQKILRPIVF